jgi:diguanylate cyclase (GGDEF)-like protein
MRVLVAEDDAIVRATVVRAIETLGWQTVPAADGRQALAQLEGEPGLELAVLDWMMPGVDGIEIARRVRASPRVRPLYLILLTSRSGRADTLAALRAGADELLAKPFDSELLLARLAAAQRVLEAVARRSLAASPLDALTGLPRRDAIVARLARDAERCARAGEAFSIALIDLQRLRDLNEKHGRGAGDAALKALAERVRAALRDTDGLGRYGGDEFLATLPVCDEAGAASCAARLQRQLSAPAPVPAPRASIGCATARPGEAVEPLILAADLALHRAQRRGASCWAVATDEDWSAAHA